MVCNRKHDAVIHKMCRTVAEFESSVICEEWLASKTLWFNWSIKLFSCMLGAFRINLLNYEELNELLLFSSWRWVGGYAPRALVRECMDHNNYANGNLVSDFVANRCQRWIEISNRSKQKSCNFLNCYRDWCHEPSCQWRLNGLIQCVFVWMNFRIWIEREKQGN